MLGAGEQKEDGAAIEATDDDAVPSASAGGWWPVAYRPIQYVAFTRNTFSGRSPSSARESREKS